MNKLIHTFILEPSWRLISDISRIDRFDASWSSIEKREGKSLKQLKSLATVRSIGASTRIEGSRMTDNEVELLLNKPEIIRFEERDDQEVTGYKDALNSISENYENIEISESSIKNLHNILMRHGDKDNWHRGKYKQHSNVVEATYADGTKQTVFETTPPGYATEDAMRNLIKWYKTDKETLPIIKTALFVYDFLSIHPFQDGNGRLSRLLTTLLLLKNGYSWIEYISFEHEIEYRKTDYYKTLMNCQRQRPGEDVYPWIEFFLTCLDTIQQLLLEKLKVQGIAADLTAREKKIYIYVESYPKCRSGEIADSLNMPLPTIKKILTSMVDRELIQKNGIGKATNYSIN